MTTFLPFFPLLCLQIKIQILHFIFICMGKTIGVTRLQVKQQNKIQPLLLITCWLDSIQDQYSIT